MQLSLGISWTPRARIYYKVIRTQEKDLADGGYFERFQSKVLFHFMIYVFRRWFLLMYNEIIQPQQTIPQSNTAVNSVQNVLLRSSVPSSKNLQIRPKFGTGGILGYLLFQSVEKLSIKRFLQMILSLLNQERHFYWFREKTVVFLPNDWGMNVSDTNWHCISVLWAVRVESTCRCLSDLCESCSGESWRCRTLNFNIVRSKQLNVTE